MLLQEWMEKIESRVRYGMNTKKVNNEEYQQVKELLPEEKEQLKQLAEREAFRGIRGIKMVSSNILTFLE